CKQQIVVIDLSVAVMIKGGKIFDKLDSSLPEYAKINTRLNDLKFTTEFESVVSDDLGDIVADLHAILFGRLRYAEAGTVQQARKSVLDPSGCRIGRVRKIVNTESKIVDRGRRNDVSPIRHE